MARSRYPGTQWVIREHCPSSPLPHLFLTSCFLPSTDKSARSWKRKTPVLSNVPFPLPVTTVILSSLLGSNLSKNGLDSGSIFSPVPPRSPTVSLSLSAPSKRLSQAQASVPFMTFGKGHHPLPVEILPLPDVSCHRTGHHSPLRPVETRARGKAARVIPSAGNALPYSPSQLQGPVSTEPPLAPATFSVLSFLCIFVHFLLQPHTSSGCLFSGSHCFHWQKRPEVWNQTLNFHLLILLAVCLWARQTSRYTFLRGFLICAQG